MGDKCESLCANREEGRNMMLIDLQLFAKKKGVGSQGMDETPTPNGLE